MDGAETGSGSSCCPKDKRLHDLMLLSRRWQRKVKRRQGTAYTNWVEGRAGLVSLIVWVVRQVGADEYDIIYIYI
jgi:hypothetical protein